MPRVLRGVWLGRRPYEPVFALQQRLHAARASGSTGDTVLYLEHTPVITLGRRANLAHVLVGSDALRQRGWDFVQTDRGGDVTLHAPGQLVSYPIVDLSPDRCDVRRYVRDLAETMRRVAERHGVAAGELPGLVGLWVDRASPARFPVRQRHEGGGDKRDMAKIGAIGVRISRWVTMHGFALNLSLESDVFRVIVPCGISAHGVTSIRELTGNAPDTQEEAQAAFAAFGDVHGATAGEVEDWSVKNIEDLV
jgi:lipoyl(octanoyl) transferase